MLTHTARAAQPILVPVAEAAAMLGLSVWTVRAWCYAGKIASHKLCNRLSVPMAEIDRIVRESERPRVAESR